MRENVKTKNYIDMELESKSDTDSDTDSDIYIKEQVSNNNKQIF